MGYDALYYNGDGKDNVAVGWGVMFTNSNGGDYNVGIGSGACDAAHTCEVIPPFYWRNS